VALVLVAGCGSSQRQPTAKAAPPTTTAKVVTTPQPKAKAKAKPKAKPKPRPRPKPNPGALPQTSQLPSADTPGFRAEMRALWAGVQQNSLAKAMPAFFPEAAYIQVKAIGDAQGDYTGRLLADYRLDLGAAHALLGAHPGSTDLVGVKLPQSSVHWVPPNVCLNRVGYWEWPNARLVYRVNGAVRSFGIASMISWRGVWYVVHLGAVVRSAATGVVDDPSLGTGVSTPSSTC
jgi:hypothetical protein